MKLTLTALPKMIADLIKHNLGFGSGCSMAVELTLHNRKVWDQFLPGAVYPHFYPIKTLLCNLRGLLRRYNFSSHEELYLLKGPIKGHTTKRHRKSSIPGGTQTKAQGMRSTTLL